MIFREKCFRRSTRHSCQRYRGTSGMPYPVLPWIPSHFIVYFPSRREEDCSDTPRYMLRYVCAIPSRICTRNVEFEGICIIGHIKPHVSRPGPALAREATTRSSVNVWRMKRLYGGWQTRDVEDTHTHCTERGRTWRDSTRHVSPLEFAGIRQSLESTLVLPPRFPPSPATLDEDRGEWEPPLRRA